MTTAAAPRLPVLFVGHGSPMNAIEDNRWSRAFAALGHAVPTPRAILAISAHWYVDGTLLTSNALPPTMHDFGGFPQALFDVQYPARGDVGVAQRVRGLLATQAAMLDDSWGLDHGTWSVLRHLRPDADVPVVQLSIDRRLPPHAHVAIGRALAPLRDEGVLIMASGNITHNLRDAFRSMRSGDTTIPPWAASFDATIASAVQHHDVAALVAAVDTEAGRMAHPSLDHYLPLLYAAGAAAGAGPVSFPVQGWDAGSLSMRSVQFG